MSKWFAYYPDYPGQRRENETYGCVHLLQQGVLLFSKGQLHSHTKYWSFKRTVRRTSEELLILHYHMPYHVRGPKTRCPKKGCVHKYVQYMLRRGFTNHTCALHVACLSAPSGLCFLRDKRKLQLSPTRCSRHLVLHPLAPRHRQGHPLRRTSTPRCEENEISKRIGRTRVFAGGIPGKS